jgi:hypothetical protein
MILKISLILVLSLLFVIIFYVTKEKMEDARRGRRVEIYFDFYVELGKENPEITNFTDLFSRLLGNKKLGATHERAVEVNEIIFDLLKESITTNQYTQEFGRELLCQLQKFYENE